VESRLTTPEAYTFTARAALAAVERVIEGHAPPGFQTPASAFGASFVLGIEGVTRQDVGG
jgi:saccharopine dehydrogenase (NAD+, L-lysine-forming)